MLGGSKQEEDFKAKLWVFIERLVPTVSQITYCTAQNSSLYFSKKMGYRSSYLFKHVQTCMESVQYVN